MHKTNLSTKNKKSSWIRGMINSINAWQVPRTLSLFAFHISVFSLPVSIPCPHHHPYYSFHVSPTLQDEFGRMINLVLNMVWSDDAYEAFFCAGAADPLMYLPRSVESWKDLVKPLTASQACRTTGGVDCAPTRLSILASTCLNCP